MNNLLSDYRAEEEGAIGLNDQLNLELRSNEDLRRKIRSAETDLEETRIHHSNLAEMMAKTRARVIADGTIVKKAEEERVVQQKGLDGVRKALEEAEEQLRGGLDRNLDKVRESYDQNISQIEESIKVQQAMIDSKAKKLRTLKLEDPITKGDEFKLIREELKTLNRRKEDLLQNIAQAESTEKLLSDRLYFEQNRVSRQARSQNTEIGIKVKADIEQLSKNVEALRQRKLAFHGIQPSEEPNTPVENAILQAQITTLNNSQQQLV